MSLTKAQQAKLMADLPASAVETRQGGGGMNLSYVPRFYVYDEMNQIFGPGSWGYRLEHMDAVVPPHEVETKRGKRWACSYLCQATLTVEGAQPITDVGYGSGIDKDAGSAVESAAKEAATDAVKRCASALGRRLGGALYQKSHEHVADPPRYANPGPYQNKPLSAVPDAELEEYRGRVAKATEDPKRKGKALQHLAEIDAEIATRPSMAGADVEAAE